MNAGFPAMFGKVRRQFDRLCFGGNAPGAFIVGAQKAGTSSLFRYLELSPNLTGSEPKEVGFFDKEYHFKKGVDWYERHFVRRKKGSQIYFEATPEYLYREQVPRRIYEYNPNAKIVILLREPVSRAYSAWNMYRQFSESGKYPKVLDRHYDGRNAANPIYSIFLGNKTPPSFQEYLDIEFDLMAESEPEEEPGLIRRGIYLPQVQRYVNLFGLNNVLLLGSEELRTNTAKTVKKAALFLTGFDAEIRSEAMSTQFHARKYKDQIPPVCRKRLAEFYRPHNDRLWEYLGKEVHW